MSRVPVEKLRAEVTAAGLEPYELAANAAAQTQPGQDTDATPATSGEKQRLPNRGSTGA